MLKENALSFRIVAAENMEVEMMKVTRMYVFCELLIVFRNNIGNETGRNSTTRYPKCILLVLTDASEKKRMPVKGSMRDE